MFLVFMVTAQSAGAQFLEKLEAVVRSQLEAAKPEPKSGDAELPSPMKAPAVPPSTKETTIPSILEQVGELLPAPSKKSSPVLDPDVNAPAAKATTGQVWLGLEAEATIGGGLGVRVSSVSQGSPAWKSGFRVGDRIQAVDGLAIEDIDALGGELSQASPGQTVRFLISRAGRNIELVSVLVDASLNTANSPTSALGPAEDQPGWLGIEVKNLSAEFRQQFGISAFRGAAVTSVIANSPAARAGIRAGDAIVEVAGQPVETADDLLRWLENTRVGDVTQLMVARGFAIEPKTVTLSLPQQSTPLRFGNATSQPATQPLQLQGSVAASPNSDPVALAPQGNPLIAELSVSVREQELTREVESLRSELAAANRRLAETEKKLQEIQKLLSR